MIATVEKGRSTCGCTPPKHQCKAAKQSLDARIRDRFIRTNIDIILIGILLALYHIGSACASEATHEETTAAAAEEATASSGHHETEEEVIHEEAMNVYAVLYPW